MEVYCHGTYGLLASARVLRERASERTSGHGLTAEEFKQLAVPVKRGSGGGHCTCIQYTEVERSPIVPIQPATASVSERFL